MTHNNQERFFALDVKKTREKIIAFAKNLGINTSKIDLRGYPYELLKKKGLIK